MLDKTEFKIGQKVKVHGVKKIGTIREINWDAVVCQMCDKEPKEKLTMLK